MREFLENLPIWVVPALYLAGVWSMGSLFLAFYVDRPRRDRRLFVESAALVVFLGMAALWFVCLPLVALGTLVKAARTRWQRRRNIRIMGAMLRNMLGTIKACPQSDAKEEPATKTCDDA